MSGDDLIVAVPWLVFAAGLAVIGWRLAAGPHRSWPTQAALKQLIANLLRNAEIHASRGRVQMILFRPAAKPGSRSATAAPGSAQKTSHTCSTGCGAVPRPPS